MRKLFLLPLLLLSMLLASAQASWRIKLNDKTVLLASKENEAANTKKIMPAAWNKNKGCLEIIYKDDKSEKDWYRSFFIGDDSGNDLIRKDSVNKLEISTKTLKKALNGKKKIIIYTAAVPSDPELAARVRIRRVHLCTLELP